MNLFELNGRLWTDPAFRDWIQTLEDKPEPSLFECGGENIHVEAVAIESVKGPEPGVGYSSSEGYEEETRFEVVVRVSEKFYRTHCVIRRRMGYGLNENTTDFTPPISPSTLDVTPFEEVVPVGVRKLFRPKP